MGTNVDRDVVARVIGYSAEYEALVVKLLAQNERLRGRLDVMAGGSRVSAALPAGPPVAAPFVAPAPVAFAAEAKAADGAQPSAEPVVKPVETWSMVVKDPKGQTAKEVASKVVTVVGPHIRERVHEIRELRDGGVIIRTPSVAELGKISSNERFKQAGLTVSVPDANLTRVVIQGVDSRITHDEFMGDLFEKNLRGSLTQAEFDAGVRIVSRPWDSTRGGATNVVVEASASALEPLLAMRRCYVKWFSFKVRPYDLVASCFRCLSFDHFARECRWKVGVCHRCGQQGHTVRNCGNAVHCRNCAFNGKPSGHRMMSEDCPVYRVMLARARAKH